MPNFEVVQTDNRPPEILLYDDIGPSYWDLIDAMMVRRALAQLGDVGEITLRINSLGGDVFEAAAIYNAVAQHPAKVHVAVDGIAASAASLIAMSGDRIEIAANAMFMIHRASTIAWGNAEDLKQILQALETIDQTAIDVYVARAGGKSTQEQLREWLDAETWFSAEAAVDAGLADAVGQALKESPQACVPRGRFANTPEPLLAPDGQPVHRRAAAAGNKPAQASTPTFAARASAERTIAQLKIAIARTRAC